MIEMAVAEKDHIGALDLSGREAERTVAGLVVVMRVEQEYLAVKGEVSQTRRIWRQHQFEGVYWDRGEDWSFVSAALQELITEVRGL